MRLVGVLFFYIRVVVFVLLCGNFAWADMLHLADTRYQNQKAEPMLSGLCLMGLPGECLNWQKDIMLKNIPRDFESIVREQYLMNKIQEKNADPFSACGYLFGSQRKTGDSTTDECCYPLAAAVCLGAILWYCFSGDDDLPPQKICQKSYFNPKKTHLLFSIPIVIFAASIAF